MATKQPQNKAKATQSEYNGWMFARDFAKGVFGLLNNGKIYPAFGLLFVGLIGLAEWRLPQDQLAPIITEILVTVRSSFGFLLAVAFATNAGWLWLFSRQKRMYDQEIARLAEMRKQLIHCEDKIIPIDNHRSSENVVNQTHIFPQPKAGKQKG
jgi:hypothetical protein